MWKGIYEGEDDNAPVKPTSNKELAVWENKDYKAYAMVSSFVSEEVSCHITPITNSYDALKKLKGLNDSHLKLEVVQLMIKLFNLDLRDNDPLVLDLEIIAITHDVGVTGVKMDILLTNFVKTLYPIYYYYLESLQASSPLKDTTFDTLMGKFARQEKDFIKRKRTC